jgi:protein TonB
MSEPVLSCPALISRPRDRQRLRARTVSFAVAAASFTGFASGLVLMEILFVESSLPPHAVIRPIRIHPPSPPSTRPSLPGGGGGGAMAATPPAPRPAPVRLEVVPLTPPLADADLPPAPAPETLTGNAADGPASNGDPDGNNPGPGCEGCDGSGNDGPGHGIGDGFGDGGPGSDVLMEGTRGIEPPVVIPSTRVHPDYPEIARKARVGGSVLLLIVIDAQGQVGSIEVLDSPDPRFGFDLAAIDAVKRWRYRPARLGGRPVSVQASVRVEFTLAR